MSAAPRKLGLALSGGGYRATAFHLGTLSKLDELKILPEVDVISTISGGSITGAYYSIYKGDFKSFYNDLYQGLQSKDVIKGIFFSWLGFRFALFLLLFLGTFIFLFTNVAWLFVISNVLLIFVFLKFQFAIFPISRRIEELYDQFFFNKSTLDNLPARPMLVIGSTNLQTAKPFTFSRHWMQDSTYQFMDDPVKFNATDFPIARAVMASSAVPFAFTPVTIDKKYFSDIADADRIHPILVDGGVYDNQGIHKVMQSGYYECKTVITSDAGAGSTGEMQFRNTFSLLWETVNVFMSRIKKAQMVRNVYDNAATANKEVAYFSLGWDVENCIPGFISNLEKKQITKAVIAAHGLKEEWVENPKLHAEVITNYLKVLIGFDNIEVPTKEEKKIARSVSTNLCALSKKQVDCLVKAGAALTEIQVKLYCPSIIK